MPDFLLPLIIGFLISVLITLIRSTLKKVKSVEVKVDFLSEEDSRSLPNYSSEDLKLKHWKRRKDKFLP